MHSELGMILPFVFVLFVVWNGTRIMLAKIEVTRERLAGKDQLLPDLAKRVQQIEESLDATTREVQRLTESERFTAQLLSGRSASTSASGISLPTDQRR
jgi:hypothetical protein